jgi:hypothetical protein
LLASEDDFPAIQREQAEGHGVAFELGCDFVVGELRVNAIFRERPARPERVTPYPFLTWA